MNWFHRLAAKFFNWLVEDEPHAHDYATDKRNDPRYVAGFGRGSEDPPVPTRPDHHQGANKKT